MESTLPFIVSVPHGGSACPPELKGRTRLLAHDLFEDSDALTDRIYDVREHAAHVEIAHIARAYVDLNRAPDDLPPHNPDGVVKSVTDHEVPVYEPGEQPGPALIGSLLTLYHTPYHDALSAASGRGDILVGLDCHSMEPIPPPIAPDAGRPRPMFCLANGRGTTCPDGMLTALGDAISYAFGIDREQVLHNAPFSGGWITRHHATADAVPWIQMEMNRSLYLAHPWFDENRLLVTDERLAELNSMFLATLIRFAKTLSDGSS